MRNRISSGSLPILLLRNTFFTTPFFAFISHGILNTYSTSLRSAKGTLASNPQRILVRSMRFNNVCIKNRIFRYPICLRLVSVSFSVGSTSISPTACSYAFFTKSVRSSSSLTSSFNNSILGIRSSVHGNISS